MLGVRPAEPDDSGEPESGRLALREAHAQRIPSGERGNPLREPLDDGKVARVGAQVVPMSVSLVEDAVLALFGPQYLSQVEERYVGFAA